MGWAFAAGGAAGAGFAGASGVGLAGGGAGTGGGGGWCSWGKSGISRISCRCCCEEAASGLAVTPLDEAVTPPCGWPLPPSVRSPSYRALAKSYRRPLAVARSGELVSTQSDASPSCHGASLTAHSSLDQYPPAASTAIHSG